VSAESGMTVKFDTASDGKPVLKLYGLEFRRVE
jgi:hypothetical protein